MTDMALTRVSLTLEPGNGGTITVSVERFEEIYLEYVKEQWRGIQHTRQWKHSMERAHRVLDEDRRRQIAQGQES